MAGVCPFYIWQKLFWTWGIMARAHTRTRHTWLLKCTKLRPCKSTFIFGTHSVTHSITLHPLYFWLGHVACGCRLRAMKHSQSRKRSFGLIWIASLVFFKTNRWQRVLAPIWLNLLTANCSLIEDTWIQKKMNLFAQAQFHLIHLWMEKWWMERDWAWMGAKDESMFYRIVKPTLGERPLF